MQQYSGTTQLHPKGAQQALNFRPRSCGQTAGWTKMSLGRKVVIGPGHIVLDGDPVPPPKGQSSSIFGPCLLWPNGADLSCC